VWCASTPRMSAEINIFLRDPGHCIAVRDDECIVAM
jgi:hypothetical protein